MESIITFIAILLIGSLFGGKKKKEAEQKKVEQQHSKPFTAQDNQQQSPFKKLKEMSQEMYKEIQQEMQQEPEPERRQPTVQRTPIQQTEVVMPPIAPVVVQAVEESKRSTRTTRASRATRRTRDARKTRERQEIGSRKTRQKSDKRVELKVSTTNTVDLMPRTEEDIMKGVIFSEIFGPPKSKR